MPTTHGLRDAPEYRVWASMKARCLNPNNPKYYRYGGRGIKICLQWVNDFAQFYADMGPRPSDKHSLDRIDNDGDYTPSNCRWAVQKTQANNRSTTGIYTYNGVTGTLYDIAAHVGLSRNFLRHRVQHGWSIEKAVETPPHADETHLEYQGRTMSMSDWGRETGLGVFCISERLRAGWSLEDALTRPKKTRKTTKQELE